MFVGDVKALFSRLGRAWADVSPALEAKLHPYHPVEPETTLHTKDEQAVLSFFF